MPSAIINVTERLWSAMMRSRHKSAASSLPYSTPAKRLAHADQAAKHVGVVVVRDALHDGRHALKAHAGIDVLGLKRGQRAIFLAVVLGEHAVPVLQEAVAIAARLAVGTAATHLGALIEVDFGARAARAGRPGAPEVIILAQTGDVVFGHAERLQISMVSSSFSNTVKYSLSFGRPSTSVENSKAHAHISRLK